MRTQSVWCYAGLLLVMAGLAGCTHQSLVPDNDPPVITKLETSASTVTAGGFIFITVEAEDPDRDSLAYEWAASAGAIEDSGAAIQWRAPQTTGAETVSVTVSDGNGGVARAHLTFYVINNDPANHPPDVSDLTAAADTVTGGESTTITATATDPDGDELSYAWSKSAGKITGSGPSILWEAPVTTFAFSQHEVRVLVSDGRGGYASRRINLTVKSPLPLPEIRHLTATPAEVGLGGRSTLSVEAISPTGSALNYQWSAIGGVISGEGKTITWTAPSGPVCCAPGPYEITVCVTNREGGQTERQVTVTVVL